MPKVRPLHFPVFLTGVLLTIAFAVYAAWTSVDHRRTDALRTAEALEELEQGVVRIHLRRAPVRRRRRALIGVIAIAYLLWRAFGPAAGSPGQTSRGNNPVGPDDDPDFLRDLDRRKHD